MENRQGGGILLQPIVLYGELIQISMFLKVNTKWSFCMICQYYFYKLNVHL